MKIRPKIIKALTGVKFTAENAKGANWRQLVFENYRLHLLDLLAAYGEANNYGYWLNEMQGRHANLYNLANQSGNWEDVAYKNDLVGQYQHDYKGDKRFGTIKLKPEYTQDFNQSGIVKAQEANRYDTSGPIRTSGDYGDHAYKVDNLYSAITDDRRLLGRKGDWDENSEEYKKWISDLRARGWDMYLDTSDNYYKLKRFGGDSNIDSNNPNGNLNDGGQVPTGHKENGFGFDWSKLRLGLQQAMPGLIETGRLIGNLATNEAVYKESLKGIRPNLQQTYLTHRQVVGDEATKLAYYKRAAAGQTKASRPFTSDADRLMAYQMEARRAGDELRAQGDLADNLEIRRTSDESNQHEWGNTQRRTEVANRNIIELNNANAARLLLAALKKAADWTSLNIYLLGRETRAREKQAEAEAIQNQIFALDELQRLSNDTEYNELRQAYSDAWDAAVKAGKTPANDPKVIEARKKFLDKQYELKRRQLYNLQNRNNGYLFAKDGLKITHTKKEDLLYKTARDAVDHFRKMTKLTDDSRHRSKTKPIKLSSHPKKMLQGGVAPFVVFTPATVGSSTSTLSTTGSDGISSRSSGSTKKGDGVLDVIKDLFSKLGAEGLPSDVNGIYTLMLNFLAKSAAFGEELTTEDLSTMYLQLLLLINNIKFSKAAYDEAKKQATSNDALDEFAVTDDGRFISQNIKTGDIAAKSWKEIKDSDEWNPLTNNNLLNIRAYNPEYMLGKGDNFLLTIVNKGIGISKIAEFIKAQLPKLGSNELTIEGYTKKQSEQILEGFKQLLEQAPDGDYHWSKKTENLKQQMTMALGYISSILPKNMKAVLLAHADMQGISTTDMLQALLGAEISETNDIKLSAVTGKAAKDSNGNSSGADGSIKSNPLMQMIQELGGVPRTWEIITRDSNVRMSVDGTFYSQIPKVNDDMSIDKMLSESGLQGILDSKQGITFGDLNISPDLLKDIMYSNTGGVIVTLPCKIVNGHKEVNLGIKKSYEDAVKEVESKGISKQSPEYGKELGNALKNKGLDSLLDSRGYPDKTKFGLFLLVEAYATTKVKGLDTSSQYIEKVNNPDSLLEDRLIKALSTDKKKPEYSLDIDYWLWGDDVYRGTMFIPLNNNLNATINAWGDQIKVDEGRELEKRYQNFNKASTMKSSNASILNERE